MSRLARTLAALALLFGPGLVATPVRAQAPEATPAEGEEEEGGGPLYGYVGTGALACAAIFVLCKSARR